jgi:hypothetical protein
MLLLTLTKVLWGILAQPSSSTWFVGIGRMIMKPKTIRQKKNGYSHKYIYISREMSEDEVVLVAIDSA